MPSRKRFDTREAIKNMAENISHKFHILEESLDRINTAQIPAKDLVKDIELIKKVSSELEKTDLDDMERTRGLSELNDKINKIEATISAISGDNSYTLEVANKLIEEIKGVTAEIPEIAEVLNIPATSMAKAPEKLDAVVKLKETPVNTVIRSSNKEDLLFPSNLAVPIHVSLEDGVYKVEERPYIDKLRISAGIKDTGKPGNHLPLMIKGITKSGDKSILGSGVTNGNGYLSIDMSKYDLTLYDRIELAAGNDYSYEISLIDFRYDIPVYFYIPEPVAEKIREKPRDFIAIDLPDATDLVNDPDSFSFDTHNEDGSACIKARPEVSVRNFHFSQLVRGEESDLIEQNGEDAAIRPREAVTAPVPVRPTNNIGANLSVVGGRIIVGKIINYRQSWQPAAQGLGKLLYSLALAPREEIKIAMIDWRRSEYAQRRDGVRVDESLNARIDRDTTVSDIVTGQIVEQISGGSEGSSNTTANNKPGWAAYLGGAIVGGIIGGPIGAGLGVAAVHFIRPDTGADSSSSIDSWNNAVRNMSARTVHTASDVVSQRSSAVRDLHSTIIQASEVIEQENVQTRTIRNQNQHHSLTIQYYQVLAHYRVVTEALSEEDVLLVPYAIDHDIFASLPQYDKFIPNPKIHTITKFCLRHGNAIRQVLPLNLRNGMDALSRLVYDLDSYEEPQITASRWTLLSAKGLAAGIDVLLDTVHGLVPLRSVDQSRTQFISNEVALADVNGIHFRLDFQQYAQNTIGNFGILSESIIGKIIDKFLEELKIVYSNVQLTAHITKTRYVRSNLSVYTFSSRGEVSLSLNNSSETLSLNTPSAAQLNTLLNAKATPRGEDYEAVEAMVNWLQHNPMAVMAAIWMTEDPNERALRFDRLSYNGQSLLNIIENQPLGVDGNYVAFRLAPNLRVLPPIDLSSIRRQSTVVSVPTSGVFAETYLSCNIATEKRDVTREIDNTKAVPFGAPDIAPIQTGSRGAMSMPQPTSMTSPVINLQSVPTTPSSNIGEVLQGLTSSSPFPNLSFGAETMETIRTLADTAMKTDGEKQKEILNTITELTKLAVDAGLAAMGIPPVSSAAKSNNGSGQSSGAGSSGRSTTGSGGGNQSGGMGQAQHRAQVGQSVRQSDPASNYDHIKVIEAAESAGRITPDKARAAIENIVGATNDTQALTVRDDLSPDIKLLPEMPNLLNQAMFSSTWKLVGVIYFPTRLPDEELSENILDDHDIELIRSIREHGLFDSLEYKIIGYADSRPDRFGNPNLNDELSFRRAKLVALELFPQDSSFPLYNEEGIMNERIQLIQAGVDTNAALGDNPRARRAEIWAVQAGVREQVVEDRAEQTMQLVRQRLSEEEKSPRNSEAGVVKLHLAKAMLDVYDEGGDLSFVGIGLSAIRSDIDRKKANNSSIERFYQGKISLQAAFSEIDAQQEIQSILQSENSVEQVAHELYITVSALAQLMINGHRYHNRLEQGIHWGASGGKWAELQNEIARRTALSEPPSIYYKAFDIENYLKLTETRQR